jgi:2-amino-4-hydroxy-6-hydroxymethyldihydropteridine diphosphokinase
MAMSEIVILSLGSNVGDRAGNLREAIERLGAFMRVDRVSPFYTSRAMLYSAQDDFLNTVVIGETELEPLQLLDRTQAVEREMGRIYRFRYGPREIDIDISFLGDRLVDSERLTIPHIGAATRDFVLVPLLDLIPDFMHPSLDRKIRDLAAEIREEDRSIIGRYDG